MPKNVKRENFGLFETPVCCKISKKNENGTLQTVSQIHGKKFLAEAGTRARDRWVPRAPKSIKVCTKNNSRALFSRKVPTKNTEFLFVVTKFEK